MQDLYYRTDADGNILMISPHGAKLAGYDSPEEMIGLNAARDIYMDPGERDHLVALLKERGSVTNYITTLKTKDGRPVVVSASSQIFFDNSGKIAGVEGILHDITDLKGTEARSGKARAGSELSLNLQKMQFSSRVHRAGIPLSTLPWNVSFQKLQTRC